MVACPRVWQPITYLPVGTWAVAWQGWASGKQSVPARQAVAWALAPWLRAPDSQQHRPRLWVPEQLSETLLASV